MDEHTSGTMAQDAGGFEDEWREPPSWPKVVGIISIVFGILNLVCNGLGALAPLITGPMMRSAAEQMEGGMPPAILNPPVWLLIFAGLGAAWAVLLIVAGGLSVARNPLTRPLHIVWAIVALLAFVIGVYYQLQQQNEIAEWVRQNPNAQFSQAYSSGSGMIGLAIGAIIALPWPIFCLIWFGFVKTKREQYGAVETI